MFRAAGDLDIGIPMQNSTHLEAAAEDGRSAVAGGAHNWPRDT